MPIASITPARMKARLKDCVAPTIKPVMIGAAMPVMLLRKFMMPPIVAAPPFGAISEGIDQPAGAAAASPLSDTVIQKIAQ